MNRTLRNLAGAGRCLPLLLTALMVCNAVTVPMATADTGAKEVNVVDTMTNYDVKLRVGKTIWRNISGAIHDNDPIDWEEIKYEVLRPSIFVHLALDQGAGLLGAGLKYTLMSVHPPYGLMAASLLSGALSGFGGGLGYEMSADIESNTPKRFGEVMGTAMKNIDATNLAARTLCGMAGTVIGQALCPMPFLGAIIGGMVGSITGGTLCNYFIKTSFGQRLASGLQQIWDRGAQSIMDLSHRKAARKPKVTLWQKLKKISHDKQMSKDRAIEQEDPGDYNPEVREILPPEGEIPPPEEELLPPEDIVAPPEEELLPPEDIVAPPEEGILPPEDTVAPPEEDSAGGYIRQLERLGKDRLER